MNLNNNGKTTFWVLFSVVIIAFLGIILFLSYKWAVNLGTDELLGNKIVKQQIKKNIKKENRFLLELAPVFLGFKEPKTYLVFFLNNTELRPGGGFIGSYGVVKVSEGKIEILTLEGVERLDVQAPPDFKPQPPDMIKNKLKVDSWYLRDSNWSPDFAVNAKRGLRFYKGEGGVAANEVDIVVGVTTQVLREILKITGPIDVQGINFSASNVVKKLQYEVEYGFKKRDINFMNRKQILKPFFKKIANKTQLSLLRKYSHYLDMLRRMLNQKHIIIFSKDNRIQNKLEKRNFAGRVIRKVKGDYLLWVDANLAALKTDHAIERKINYRIRKKDGEYIATASMTYNHTGSFDWRTSRYRSFARVYTPKNSTLIGANFAGSPINLDKIKKETELGKTWFGKFITIEPGEKRSLSFSYKLPKKTTQHIKDNRYTLMVQKQIGTNKPKLTLDLDFDKNIRGASPAETKKLWGDDVYNISTNLKTDRRFNISF